MSLVRPGTETTKPASAGLCEHVGLEHELMVCSVNLGLSDADVHHRHGWAAVVQHLAYQFDG